ncbi:MAG: glutathione S-transferase N-terminal domain-containing protein [Gammaproteobacteria bacterium]|uniref:glutathione S-transferase N-terminal domain-containing protein n=1 Tax=unclassified Pseudacidovorax TaxID=2620592 RepID=UPI001B6AA242|nr:glutathione S-transferase N-terminal domain-containing protein [Pseudacidovorax sp.]MBP6893278.1 glutathione S-transferase N-terminal domain-containing protein [Pseudacidovorax sp.]
MKLIGSTSSPYVRKVRVVMAEKRLDYEFVQEDVWADDTTIATSNPLGKVPCLVMDGGDAMFDSRVIVEYLDTLSPVGKLIPASGRERAEVKTWEALADGVMDAGVLWRMEAVWPKRADSERSQAWMDRQRGKVEAGIAAMAKGLGDKPFCSGIHLSLSDIAVVCALDWIGFRFPDLDWRAEHPSLARLCDKLHQRPSIKDTAPR